MGMQRNADMLGNQWARLQDGEGMQNPIPEYYFMEKGEDCFSSGKAVQIEECIFTDKGAPALARKDRQILLFVCPFSRCYEVHIKRKIHSYYHMKACMISL